MKLKCKSAFTPSSNGMFGIGAHGPKPIKGLTEGKEYNAEFVPVCWHVFDGTQIDKSDIKAMIYNDHNEWETYDLKQFEPADGN